MSIGELHGVIKSIYVAKRFTLTDANYIDIEELACALQSGDYVLTPPPYEDQAHDDVIELTDLITDFIAGEYTDVTVTTTDIIEESLLTTTFVSGDYVIVVVQAADELTDAKDLVALFESGDYIDVTVYAHDDMSDSSNLTTAFISGDYMDTTT